MHLNADFPMVLRNIFQGYDVFQKEITFRNLDFFPKIFL